MKTLNPNMVIKLLLTILMVLTLSGCGQVATDSNFTLEKTVSGSLFIFSQNAILAESSSVDGSVIMLCCNLTVNGTVGGDVYLLMGNVKISPQATVDGDVSVLSGNVSE